jgi:phosphopantothenate-cysteine ligase
VFVLKILVTSGGTCEKIDDVRKIKNMATGKLGALIAEQFAAQGNAEIIYLCGADAIVPAGSGITTIKIESVRELMETLEKLLAKVRFDAVIHAMAVSDYAVKSVVATDALVCAIAEAVSAVTDGDSMTEAIRSAVLRSSVGAHKKISSDIDGLMISMEKTPKVIRLFKQVQPETVLVGFKLLVAVDEETLIKTGHGLLLRNQCDFVLANDLTKIKHDSHAGLLIDRDAAVQRYSTKKEIARGIAANVLAKIGGAK